MQQIDVIALVLPGSGPEICDDSCSNDIDQAHPPSRRLPGSIGRSDSNALTGHRIDQTAPVPAFPQGTETLVCSALDILSPQVLDDARDAVFLIGCDQSAHVITHQAIGMKLRAIACKGFIQKLSGIELI